MLLGGLWHGANWTFVIWGALHGVALGFVHLVSRYTVALPRRLSWLVTFHFVTFAWIFFRARDFASAQRFIAETLRALGARPAPISNATSSSSS